MKSFHSALLLTLCLALGSSALAEARPSSHSGTSSSYKSGFSSQKSNSSKSSPVAPPAANRQSGPGAFGKAPGSPASATPRNTSAASRDLDQSAAQANALKTLDARRAAAATPAPLPPNDTVLRPQQSPVYQAPPVYQQPPVIVQQPSSGLMHGVLGFMLGRAMSQSHQPVSYPTTSSDNGGGTAPVATDAQSGMVNGMPGLGAPVPAAPPAAPEPSFGATVARWFVWLSVLSVIGWALVYTVRKLRRLRTGNATNYSFERN
jgi:hypothetical protein